MRDIAFEIELEFPFKKPVLALGGELKNTVCCAKGKKAFISNPLSDLENADDYERFVDLVKNLPHKLGLVPEIVACDMHPDFISTKTSKRSDIWPDAGRVAIQHHEAHIASCAAAEKINSDFIGLAFDGTGYGTDGTMWGGEIFTGSIYNGFNRIARLMPIELPGGMAAIREPWRLALSLANAAEIEFERPAAVTKEKWLVVNQILQNKNMKQVEASSFGRLFDGVAALLDICHFAKGEAEAAIALEEISDSVQSETTYSLPYEQNEAGLLEINWKPMVKQIIEDYRKGIDKEKISAAFHDSIAESVFELCNEISDGRKIIVASGGVFFNKRLTFNLKQLFETAGFKFVLPEKLPPSDAGLSLGQAVMAS
ncbi:carbamoyltransferase HypF [bacterium]|nr:carbamoyltransferase HypF [bacterium]